MIRRTVVTLGIIFSLAQSARVDAAQITLLCSSGIKAVVEVLLPKFEAATGTR